MIADDRPPLARTVYDFFECVNGLGFRGAGMCCHPLVHFSNVRCRPIGIKELRPIRPTPLRHELRLPANRSPAPRDANMSLRELLLHRNNQRFHIGWMRSRRRTRPWKRNRVQRMMRVMPMTSIYGFRQNRAPRHGDTLVAVRDGRFGIEWIISL